MFDYANSFCQCQFVEWYDEEIKFCLHNYHTFSMHMHPFNGSDDIILMIAEIKWVLLQKAIKKELHQYHQALVKTQDPRVGAGLG